MPLADGRLQKVTYYVEGDSGFVAQVSYEGEARYPPVHPHQPQHIRPGAHTKPHRPSKHSHISTPHYYSTTPHAYKPTPNTYKATPHSYNKPTPVPRPTASYNPALSYKPTTPSFSPSYFTPGADYSTPPSAFLSTGLGSVGTEGYHVSQAYPRSTPGDTPDLSFTPSLAPHYKTSSDQ